MIENLAKLVAEQREIERHLCVLAWREAVARINPVLQEKR